ncbi:MAG: hypothetical protein K2F70_03960 [Muribaculaceae bacterium]|nr:hypothetical protein [Muribaculaceae bacterium]
MTLYKDNRIFSKQIFVKASHCGPQQDLPLQSLVSEIIDIATEHANDLGIGYDYMIRHDAAWILGCISLRMKRFPECNRTFTLRTWILNVNPYFSERAVAVIGEDGTEIGFAITVWMAIDINKRHAARLDRLFPDGLPVSDIPADMEPRERLPKISSPEGFREHRFQYSDMDCNRHVTTTRYVEQIVNLHDMAFYDTHRVSRFDITFHAETHAGDLVRIEWQEIGDDTLRANIMRDGTLCTAALISFEKK